MGGMTSEVTAETVEPDYDHLWHCDPTTALCGADLTDPANSEWRCPAYGCNHPSCPLCELVLESGCPLC